MTKLSLHELQRRVASLTGSIEFLEVIGSTRRADRLDNTRRRLQRACDARRLARLDLRRRIVVASLDTFDNSDEELRWSGAVVEYSDGERIVGVSFRQAFAQYGRLKQALIAHAISDESAEWTARNIALSFLERRGAA